MFQCSVCSFQSIYKYNVDRHEKVKHSKSNFTPHTINNNVTHQTGSCADVPMEQTAPSHSQNEKHSNVQEESIDQLNILEVDLVVPILILYWLCRALVILWFVVINLVL